MKWSRTDFLKLLFSLLAGANLTATGRKMIQRNIPGKTESLPVIGLGTWQSFDVSSAGEIENLASIVREFVRLQGRMFDSSPMYGAAEKVTGIVTKNIREKLFLATKVWTSGKENGIKQIATSFRLMNTRIMDLFQIHNLSDWKTQLQSVKELKEKGQIRYTGITHYVPSAFEEMEKIIKTREIDFIQIPYSIVTRDAEKRILAVARDTATGIIVNRPFEGGSIFRRIRTLPVPDFLKPYGSWAQIMLKYVISHPDITCVIPATSKMNHLQENMQAGYEVMEESDRKKAAQYIANLV